jgi:hypothetical protein
MSDSERPIAFEDLGSVIRAIIADAKGKSKPAPKKETPRAEPPRSGS